MTTIMHVVGTDSEPVNKLAVIVDGEYAYRGDAPTATELHNLLESINGVADSIKLHVVSIEEMNDPMKAVYGDDCDE